MIFSDMWIKWGKRLQKEIWANYGTSLRKKKQT